VAVDGVIEWALRPAAPVGTNLRGGASGAGWLYALPRLHHDRVASVGAPPLPSLAGLVQAAATVLVVEADPLRRRRVLQQVERSGWTGVQVVAPESLGAAGERAGLLDLLVLGRRARGRWVLPAWRLLSGRLAADGVAYRELPRRPGARRRGDALDVRLTPLRGEVRSVVPAGDATSAAAVARLGLEGTVLRRPAAARLERRLTRLVPGAVGNGRRARVTASAGGPADAPPRYLRDVALSAGVDLSGWRWAVCARGEYDSQKVLVLLTPPDAPEPTGLVKVTRSSAHVERLVNEGRALHRLTGLPAMARRVPAPWFEGRHGGRVLLGQSVLPGVPFARTARWTADCPQLRDCLDALGALAAATATGVPAATVADALLTLLARYEVVYSPPAGEAAALREHFETLTAAVDLPTVFQHGDPHPGNLLTSPSGRTLFLDWESAEPRGLPLWDTLYFFRSYAVTASRRNGVRDPVRAATRHLLDASPLADLLVEAVDRDVARLGLPRTAVGPLVLGCWMHRALKEATRLPPGRLDTGPSLRLLRETLRRPGAPTTARLTT
jgi:hypothetical protein